jgi:hypothetical protein
MVSLPSVPMIVSAEFEPIRVVKSSLVMVPTTAAVVPMV